MRRGLPKWRTTKRRQQRPAHWEESSRRRPHRMRRRRSWEAWRGSGWRSRGGGRGAGPWLGKGCRGRGRIDQMAATSQSPKPDPSLGDGLSSDWDLGLEWSSGSGSPGSVAGQQISEWDLTPSREQSPKVIERWQFARDGWGSVPLEQLQDLPAHLSLSRCIAIFHESTFPPSSLQHLANGRVQLQDHVLHEDFPILTREQGLMERL